LLGPEDIKVELVEVKAQATPIQLAPRALFGEQRDEMQAWYGKVFGATVNPANPNQVFVTDQLPGVTLSFASATPTVATQAASARSHRLRG
jgi:hypothetical protein